MSPVDGVLEGGLEEQTPPKELEWAVWMKNQDVEGLVPKTGAAGAPEGAVEGVDELLEEQGAAKESRRPRRGRDAASGPVEKQEVMGNELVDDRLRAAAACRPLEAGLVVDEELEMEDPDADQPRHLTAGGAEVVVDGVQEVEEKEVLPLPHLRQTSMRV